MKLKALIFDLDGVLTDTAAYHYQAWKQLANEKGVEFNWEINHQLRGVSRRASMEIIFKNHNLSEEEITEGMKRKNEHYQALITNMTQTDVLPGALDLIKQARDVGIKVGLGSASKNAKTVLDAIGLTGWMDAIGDGYSVEKGKPEPDLFLHVAGELGVQSQFCAVVEDAEAGIEAALRAGMAAIGIGDPARLSDADVVYPSLEGLNLDRLINDLKTAKNS